MKKYKEIYGLYAAEEEKRLVKQITPEYYIDKNIGTKNIDVKYATRFLQNQLNEILNSFLNGGFSKKGFVFYPFVKDVSKDNINKIRRLRRIAIFLNKNNYDFSDSLNAFKKSTGNGNFTVILSSLYRDFSKIKQKGNKTFKKTKCKEFDLNDYKKSDLKFLNPLNELKGYAVKNLGSYLKGFYLHGSLATKDYIKRWSDVDTIGIVSKGTIENPKSLLELRDKIYHSRKFLYWIDPLQHHGSIMISEYDMENYCQAYFPVQIFQYSKSFFKDDRETQFSLRDFSSESLNRMFWFVSYFRGINLAKKYDLGSYEAKNMLHAVALFPALYLQAKGQPMYKKFSFDRAKKDFDKRAWKVIDYVSSLRNNWKGIGVLPLIKIFSNINPVLCYQLNGKIADIFNGIGKKNRINIRYIADKMQILSEEAWKKVIKNAKI